MFGQFLYVFMADSLIVYETNVDFIFERKTKTLNLKFTVNIIMRIEDDKRDSHTTSPCLRQVHIVALGQQFCNLYV